jgi:hypothetical protein
VGTTQISDSSVTTAKINDSAITTAKTYLEASPAVQLKMGYRF